MNNADAVSTGGGCVYQMTGLRFGIKRQALTSGLHWALLARDGAICLMIPSTVLKLHQDAWSCMNHVVKF